MKELTRFALWLKTNAAAILYSLNTGVALLMAFGLKLPHSTVADLTTAFTGVVTLATFIAVKPRTLTLFKGGATTLLVAAAGFGLHLTTAQIGVFTAAASIIVGSLLHLNIMVAQLLQPPALKFTSTPASPRR